LALGPEGQAAAIMLDMSIKKKEEYLAVLMLPFFLSFFIIPAAADEGSAGLIESERSEKMEDALKTTARVKAHELDICLRFTPSARAKAIEGKVGIFHAESEYSYELKVKQRLPVRLNIGTQYISIDNSTQVDLPPHLNGFSAGLETTFPFFGRDKTYQRIGIFPSFYGDDWNFDTSDFRLPFRYLLIRQQNEFWTFIAGVAVYPGFETEVLPVLGFIYQPNEKLLFNIVPKRPGISYALNDRITLLAEGGSYFNNEYEVKKDGQEGVIVRLKETRLAAGVIIKLNELMRASLTAGDTFGRSIKYRDSLGKINLKDSPFVELRLTTRL